MICIPHLVPIFENLIYIQLRCLFYTLNTTYPLEENWLIVKCISPVFTSLRILSRLFQALALLLMFNLSLYSQFYLSITLDTTYLPKETGWLSSVMVSYIVVLLFECLSSFIPKIDTTYLPKGRLADCQFWPQQSTQPIINWMTGWLLILVFFLTLIFVQYVLHIDVKSCFFFVLIWFYLFTLDTTYPP